MSTQQLDEEVIFNVARKIDSLHGRADYLRQVCGNNQSLLARVQALLEVHEQESDFLACPLADHRADVWSAFEQPEITERPGTVIGAYKLLEQIGEGGFGVVFMAEQQQPMRRKVALKVLKPGMDTRQIIARFEAERQALALMDHPHIAHVFDGGEASSGRPYFVMELVCGIPITDFCDQNRLPIRERLELFVSVCHAVQHAHQKGVIHRDLKPSNVMVTLHGSTPVVKVIDFGIAKAMGQQLTEKTLFTNFAQMIGTPVYMSPEQAQMSGLDIDTRSDIYSLGVLLYELLTGTTPIEKERLGAAGYHDVRRIVGEEESENPSTRISRLGSTVTVVSANRHSDPKRLLQSVRGELDWIVMKALEKERNRRYETATAFAADVQRYLHGETVLACPPTLGYRLRKIMWRHKGPVWAAALVLLALVGGIIGTTFGLVEARRQRDVAAEAAERLQSASAHLERGRWFASERHWDDAHAAFTKAIQLRPDHVAVWVERGDFYTHLGLWDLAAADYARQIALREPDTALRWFQHALLRRYIGDLEGYHRACESMRERFRGTLQIRFVQEVVRSCNLGPSRGADFAQMVKLVQEAVGDQPLNSLYILGTTHYRAGEDIPAIQRLNEALAVPNPGPLSLLSYPVLAMAYHRQGRAIEARTALDEAAKTLDRWTQDRYVSQQEHWVIHQGAEGVWRVPWWDYLEYECYYREAKVLIDGSPRPDDPRLHVLRARAFAGLRWREKAVAEYDAALKLGPQDVVTQLEAHRSRGSHFIDLRHWNEAAAAFTKASELRPDDAYLWRFRAVANIAAGDADGYRQTCATMIDRFEKTEDAVTAGNVLLSCVLRDDALADMGRLLPLTRVADSIWHWGTWVRGAALYRAGRYEQSVRCFEAAATAYRPRAWDWCFLAMAHHHLGHAEKARHCIAMAHQWIRQANSEELDDLSGTRPAWGDWHESVVYPLLLSEAEALVDEVPIDGFELEDEEK